MLGADVGGYTWDGARVSVTAEPDKTLTEALRFVGEEPDPDPAKHSHPGSLGGRPGMRCTWSNRT